MLDRNRRDALVKLFSDWWFFEPVSSQSWEDFVEVTAKSDIEIGYLQGLKDRNRVQLAPLDSQAQE